MERVKSVDIHPTEPWALAGLHCGNLIIWDYEKWDENNDPSRDGSTTSTTTMAVTAMKAFELSDLSVRCARFLVRKEWVIAASDDMRIRAYNYNTMEKMMDMEAHTKYIRSLVVHPTLPYILSSSEDMSVKLWDFDNMGGDGLMGEHIQTYEGHSHHVMQVCWNPKDTKTFASASLDCSIKVWGINSPSAQYTLEGHEGGVNTVDYYPSGEKPYILSGSDDHTLKIWNYQTKTVVHTLEGHSRSVCDVLFHPSLPLIASASEDGTIILWRRTTYRRETTLNYSMDPAWSLAATKENNMLAIGYEGGCIVIELESDDPTASIDGNGKIVWCKDNEVQAATVRGLASELIAKGDVDDGGNYQGGNNDGEPLPLVPRDLGKIEIYYPQMLKHNYNGQFFAVCGDGKFIIYDNTAHQKLRAKAFGQALDFVWSGSGTGDYAILESISSIQVFNNFCESKTIRPATSISAEGLYGGQILGVKDGDSSVLFYDWDSGILVRKIDICPKGVYWSDAGNLVLLACADTSYMLSYDAAKVSKALSLGGSIVSSERDGIDGCFKLLYDIHDTITSGTWVGDCFLFINDTGNLKCSVGGLIQNIQQLDSGAKDGATKNYKVLGYLAKEDRVYLIDKALNVTSYKIMSNLLQYQTALMKGDLNNVNKLLPLIPESEYRSVAKFLEAQGFQEEAMAVTTDLDHKFDLALELNQIDTAYMLMLATPEKEKDSTHTMTKWKRLKNHALKASNYNVCEKASIASNDVSGLFLSYLSLGNLDGMKRLCSSILEKQNNLNTSNVAFSAANLLLGLLGGMEQCYKLLHKETHRLSGAAIFARTHLPSKVPGIITLWKNKRYVTNVPETAVSHQSLTCNPKTHPNMFPDNDIAPKVEQARNDTSDGALPAVAPPAENS